MSESEKKLPVEDAWRVYELIETMNDFLHQPENYKTVEDVERWLDSGVYDELKHVLYHVVNKWFPVDERTSHVFPPPGVKRRFPYA
jgi:hypothetical protein